MLSECLKSPVDIYLEPIEVLIIELPVYYHSPYIRSVIYVQNTFLRFLTGYVNFLVLVL